MLYLFFFIKFCQENIIIYIMSSRYIKYSKVHALTKQFLRTFCVSHSYSRRDRCSNRLYCIISIVDIVLQNCLSCLYTRLICKFIGCWIWKPWKIFKLPFGLLPGPSLGK